MCTVLLPPGDNQIAVNKYINLILRRIQTDITLKVQYISLHVKCSVRLSDFN